MCEGNRVRLCWLACATSTKLTSERQARAKHVYGGGYMRYYNHDGHPSIIKYTIKAQE